MAAKFSQSLTLMLLLSASMFALTMANKDFWSFGFNYTDWWIRFGNPHLNRTKPVSQNINVGGSQSWRFGFNYTDWAIKTAPFYLNDTLVFKYEAPNATTFPHSVYLFSNYWSFLNCDLKRAKMVGNNTQGGRGGFKFVIKRWQPHYFACGERNGFHCKNGQMKFAVMPMIRPFWTWP